MQADLGLDIGKAKFDAALLLGEKFKTKVFSNDAAGWAALSAWLAAQSVTTLRVCLEATGTYGLAVATYLHDQGHQVSIVNPAQIKAFAATLLSRNKTDRADARLIARFSALHQPAPWQPPPREIRLLQALVRRLEALQQMLQQEQNRLDSADPAVATTIVRHLEFLRADIAAVRQQIRDHIDQHPDLRRKQALLDSIPGIGQATIAQLLAFISTRSFTSARQVAAFVGLSPQLRQSGSSVHGKTRISKTGRANLRKALYMPALVAWRHNPVISAFCQRLADAGKPKMVIAVAAMRKLLHIAYGVLKSGQPFNPNLT
jgi:transposase